jgi:hypothetical protein
MTAFTRGYDFRRTSCSHVFLMPSQSLKYAS